MQILQSAELSTALNNCPAVPNKRKQIMAILNLTPDSFSGDGLLSKKMSIEAMVDYAQGLCAEGADIIDIGGESSRPGARVVPKDEEIRRTIPLVKRLSKELKTPLSIDTYKPEVAQRALDAGAAIVNDISGLRNPRMLKVIKQYQAGVVIMHMQGTPRTMQKNPYYEFLIAEIIDYLGAAAKKAVDCGVKKEKIIIDPGIGFGKNLEHNLEIFRNLKELKVLGFPILVGPSRKSFIGKILGLPPQERLSPTLAAVVIAAVNGADILRVHDVKPAQEALRITEAILGAG